MTVATATATERGAPALTLAATVFAAAVVLHNLDHLRRGGDAASAEVFWIGSAAIVLEVAIVFLVHLRHRVAPLAATAIGFSLAVGYVVVHFTPERSFFSDSFVSGGAEAVSILAASLETLGALVLGVTGLAIVRRTGLAAAMRPTGGATETTLWATARHPVVAAFAAVNLVVFLVSLGERLS